MLNIKIKLEDFIEEFQVNDMDDLVSQITNKLRDQNGNPLSEEDKRNAYWMSVELDAAKIELENGMELELKCIINDNNMVRNNNLMNRFANYIRGNNNTKSTSFILKPKSEEDYEKGKLTQQVASFARTSVNLAKKTRYYQW